MKSALMIVCAAAVTFIFTACEEPTATEKAAKEIEKTSEKAVGVPDKVFKQIKGFEKEQNKKIQKQLDKM